MRLIWERNREQLLQCGVALACLFVIATADARQWMTITGQTFEAEFVRVEGENGLFRVKDREDPYPLARLSVADRLLIGRTVHSQGATAAQESTTSPLPDTTVPTAAASVTPAKTAAGGLQVASQPLNSGGENVVLLALSEGFQPTAQSVRF